MSGAETGPFTSSQVGGRDKQTLRIGADRVNVKGKSHEGVDAIGEGRAIEVHAVALLRRLPDAEGAPA